jgi:hypothetical protein
VGIVEMKNDAIKNDAKCERTAPTLCQNAADENVQAFRLPHRQ